MARMHAEIAEHTDFAAGAAEAFPVRDLGRIEVAAVMEPGNHLQYAAKLARLHRLRHTLRAWEEGKLRAAAREAACARHGSGDVLCRAEIKAEGLLREEIL